MLRILDTKRFVCYLAQVYAEEHLFLNAWRELFFWRIVIVTLLRFDSSSKPYVPKSAR